MWGRTMKTITRADNCTRTSKMNYYALVNKHEKRKTNSQTYQQDKKSKQAVKNSTQNTSNNKYKSTKITTNVSRR